MSTADFSRHLFQPEKRYVGAFLQQGRVLTDEDLNAHRRLDAEDERLTFRDIICARGTPNTGFQIDGLTPTVIDGHAPINFQAASGSYYLGGLRFAILDKQPETFLRQSDWLQIDVDPPALPTRPAAADLTDANGNPIERYDLIFLRAWEQDVTATEDSELLERALGGPDTSVYRRRMRRLEVLTNVPGECGEAFSRLLDSITAPLRGDSSGVAHQFDLENCELRSKARLTVGFSGTGPSEDLCKPKVAGGYLGAENQAIRVQLTATNRFIWGYDNASPLYRVQATREDGLNRIEFLTLPRDEFAQPQAGQAVEILPWGAILPNKEKVAELNGHLATVITGYDPDTRTIQISKDVPGDWVNWLDAPAHADYLSPRDQPEDRKYFYLRVWTGGSGNAAAPDFGFTPGTAVELSGTGLRVTFTNFGLPQDYWVIAARPNTPDVVVPWNLLDQAAPVGPRWFFGSLALIRWRLAGQNVVSQIIDCRTRFRPLCDQRGCCTFIVGDGKTSHGTLDSIQEAVDQLPDEGGRICLLPGVHVGNVKVAGKGGVRIEGCDEQTVVIPGPGERELPVFTIVDSTGVTIEHITVTSLGGIAFRLEETSRGSLSEATLAHNQIIAYVNAVQARGGSSLRICCNRMRMVDRAGAGEAIVIRAADSVIERNDVAVKPASPEQPGEPGQTPSDEDNPEDPCADLERIYANRGTLIAKTTSLFAAFQAEFSARLPFALPYRALGGIRIAAGAEKIKVVSNRITGGAGNGITLGGSAVTATDAPVSIDAGFTIRNDFGSIYAHATQAGAGVPGLSIRFTRTEGVATSVAAVTDPTGHLLERAEPGVYSVSVLSPGYRVASVSAQDLGEFGFRYNIVFEPDIPRPDPKLGFIYDTVIEGNEIIGMGLSGIGSPLDRGVSLASSVYSNLSTFAARPTATGNPMLGAVIKGNTIVNCLLNPFDDDLRSLAQTQGLGGISLDFASALVINENIIRANGRNQLDPVCGIFVGAGDQLEIHRNQIIDNGPIDANLKLEPRAGIRGGIVVGISLRLFPVAGRLGFLRDYAARIHDNLIRHPVGQALLLAGIGPMSIDANSLHSLRSAQGALGSLFGTALVLNRGNGKKLFSGSTNFNNNQVLGGPDIQSFGTIGILTADDLGFDANPVEAQNPGIEVPVSDGLVVGLLLNAFLVGQTLSANDSRFKEPVARFDPNTGNLDLMVSLLSLTTTLNNTVNNQGDHCILAFSGAGSARVRDALNQVLVSLLCQRSAEALQAPVSAFLRSRLGSVAFQPGGGFTPVPQFSPLDPEAQVLQAQASASFAEVSSAEINVASGLVQIDAEVRALVQYESARIKSEVGEQDPRVASFQSQLGARLNDSAALSVEADLASLKVPGVEEGGMLIHGRVTDSNDRGIGSVLVCLIDSSGVVVAGIAQRTTDLSGYFAFALSSEDVKRLVETQPAGSHVSFFTSRGSPIFTTKTPLPSLPDRTEVVNLHLDRDTFEVLDPFKPGPGPEPQLIEVPDLIGLTQEEARAKLRDAHLTLGAVGFQPATAAQIGRVLVQKPDAGSKVAHGTSIDVVIGSEQVLVTVPDFAGSSLGQARSLIAQANLTVGKIEPPTAPDAGIVSAQEPKSASQVAPGTAVDLQVRPAEEPPPVVSVPNVLQSSLSASRKILSEVGLIAGNIQPADAADESIVVAQSPAAGKDVERGSAVDLVMQELSQKVAVPNVVDRQLSEAKQALARSRLKIGKINPADAPEASLVTKQSPAPGIDVDQGTSVDLEVRPPSADPAIRIIRRVAEEPDFEKIGASEAKLLRLAEEEGIRSENDLRGVAESEDAAVRDQFRLRNLESARAFKEILLRVTGCE